MSYVLADFQNDVHRGCQQAWNNGAQHVMPVLPTGAGKTVIMGHDAHVHDGHGLSMAHRGELVGQISLALAREGKQHDIVAPDALIRTIVAEHMREIGHSFYNARANWKVASVDTLVRRQLPVSWVRQVTKIHGDEGHHYLRENKWGRAVQQFENACGMFPTATPERADGKGLGRHADGIVDALVEGPGMRWLIEQGHLTDYRVIMPKTEDLDLSGLEISSATGDYKQSQVVQRVKSSSRIIGNVVHAYMEYARGMKGLTFAVDVEHAHEICAEFLRYKVPAAVITATSPESERREQMRRLRTGDLMQLINVDLFGEGTDVPAVQVVSMARPTASYGLYTQQFGRALRLLIEAYLRQQWHQFTALQRRLYIAESAKPLALVIDHVENVITHHGPPDFRQTPWSLDARERRRGVASDAIPGRACGNPQCLQYFMRIYPACPYCGWVPPEPIGSRPEMVDGDLMLYTPELLRELFAKATRFDPDSRAAIPFNQSDAVIHSVINNHANSVAAQAALRRAMDLVLPLNMDERVRNRRFFHMFGIDTLTAKGLTSADANKLRDKIIQRIMP